MVEDEVRIKNSETGYTFFKVGVLGVDAKKIGTPSGTKMGVGNFTPTQPLQVASTTGGSYTLVVNDNGYVGINTNTPQAMLHIKANSNTPSTYNNGVRLQTTGSNYWDMYIWGGNPNLEFGYNNSTKGYLRTYGSGQLNFTGQHRTFIKDTPFTQATSLEGLIVSSNQNKYIKMSGGIEAGSRAITINEALPLVSISTTSCDKKCFGVISTSEDPEKREEEYGNFVSVSEKEDGDTRVYINSVGEGSVWVSNSNGNLEAGDYITTSNVAGYGQKQDDDLLHNYTVAKITMDCDFNPNTYPVQVIKKRNGTNDLDEHGQIQWEDDPSGATEKAYKLRYLTADGSITDEANAVYTSAFVGCTYHCG